MAVTLHDRLIAGLKSRGETVVLGKTAKYTIMTRTRNPPFESFYFIGKNGGLRAGRILTNSSSLTGSKFYNDLLGLDSK